MINSSNESLEESSQKIYGTGIAMLIANLLFAPFFGFGTYMIYQESANDSYIAVIIGIILSILPLTMLLFINKYSESKSIIDLNVNLFGKIFGNVLNVVLNLTYFFCAVIVFYNISNFFSLNYLQDTQKIYIDILILLAISYGASKNSAVISRMSQIIFFINIIFFFVCQIGIFKEYQIDRIYPILQNGINPVIKSSLKYFICLSFPIFLVTIIPNYEIHKDSKNNLKISIFYFLMQLCVLAIVFSTIIIMGEKTLIMFRYPEYEALKTFSLFEIIERIEDTLSLQFLFSMFVFMVMCLHFIIRSLKKVFKNNQSENLFPLILCFLILIISKYLFKNVTESFDSILPLILKIIFIGIFIPMLITFAGLLIKNIIKKVSIKKA